ncbi:MAG: RNA polymerase sigma factor [Planctomycetaceae bacterium]
MLYLETSVELVMQRLSVGDPSAASEVFHRFSGQLIQLAQQRLNWRLRRKLDPEDVVQSAFQSFFRLHSEQKTNFANWEALWGLLSLITLRKCGRKLEYFKAACRDIDLESSPFTDANHVEHSRGDWEAVARDPTPAQAAILAETLEDLLDKLNDLERRATTLCLQGHTVAEISQQIGRSERTVQRLLERLEKELFRRCYEPADGGG